MKHDQIRTPPIPVAIVALGGVFPGAQDLEQFWQLNVHGRSAITKAAPHRLLGAADLFTSGKDGFDHINTDLAGVIDDYAATSGLAPRGIDSTRLDPAARLTLAAAAMLDRQGRLARFVRNRVSVILGAIALPTTSSVSLYHNEVGEDRQPRFATDNADAAFLPARIIQKAYGLEGRALSLDAACASSLYALALARDELASGRADAVITGGVSRPDLLYTLMGFTQLKALSRRGQPRPFDQAGDGLVVGEGAGLFLLRRLDDALRDGDFVHAVIRGIGLSNDMGGSLLAPDSEGQVRAMAQAYSEAGVAPWDIDMIECHATGTPLGDRVELRSLAKLWQDAPKERRAVLSSVKANCGHLLTAAGAAGLTRLILSMQHGMLPPLAGNNEPLPELLEKDSPWRILKQAEAWPEHASRSRRGAISGFGFGGINAHIILEASPTAANTTAASIVLANKPGAISSAVPSALPQPRLAIVARALHLGQHQNWSSWQTQLCDLENPIESLQDPGPLAVDGQFRIPPSELDQMLPQQRLMLQVAAQAMRALSLGRESKPRWATYIGIRLDPMTNRFHKRWQDLASAAQTPPSGEPLTVGSTLGSLGGMVASRIAREFGIGGAAYTIAADTTTAREVLITAYDALRQGVIDAALVGAVDIEADGSKPQTGAIAMVLMREEDAISANQPILFALDFCEEDTAYAVPSPTPNHHEFDGSSLHVLGKLGVLQGFADLAIAMLSLEEHLLPADAKAPRRYWLRNLQDGPRVALPIATRALRLKLTAASDPPAELSTKNLKKARGQIYRARGHNQQELAQNLSQTPAHPGQELGQGPLGIGYVAAGAESATTIVKAAEHWLTSAQLVSGPLLHEGAAFFANLNPEPHLGKVAFVYPGVGQFFPGMGRDLAVSFRDLMDARDAKSSRLADRFCADSFWQHDGLKLAHPQLAALAGQVAYGCLMTDIAHAHGLEADVALGYSLGESTALIALGLWRDPDLMFARLLNDSLFKSELGGSFAAAKRYYGLTGDADLVWATSLVLRPEDEVRQALQRHPGLFLLNINTPRQVVVGGPRPLLGEFLASIRHPPLESLALPVVHCPIVEGIKDHYLDFHTHDIVPNPQLTLYSCANGEPVSQDADSVARSILRHSVYGVNFPAAVERAYADGVRLFVEMGPGASTTRMIKDILGARPHTALSLCPGPKGIKATMTALMTCLVTHRSSTATKTRQPVTPQNSLAPPRPAVAKDLSLPPPSYPTPQLPQGTQSMPMRELPNTQALAVIFSEAQASVHAAQAAFLQLSKSSLSTAAEILARQFQADIAASSLEDPAFGAMPEPRHPAPLNPEPAWLDYQQCLELARGKIGNVLGPVFAEVDSYPTRVRLPDEPLLLCHRIMSVDATPLSMSHGTLVTEHDVRSDAWYLDAGVIPTGIAVEAGQADLFLSGYLGADFATKGLARYRLLDAVVEFHRGLPGPDTVIRYCIKIHNFFSQGETLLFRFSFEASIDGMPFISMRQGTAGFFTARELEAGRGIVSTKLAALHRPGRYSGGFAPIDGWPGIESYDDHAINALRHGDFAAAFGENFSHLGLAHPYRLQNGLMRLIDRIEHIEQHHGRYGLGLVRAEADIRPDAWYLTCHFVDDVVMPGTLMFEACVISLKVFLLRQGLIGEAGQMLAEPIPGISSRLKCRGQVLTTTKKVVYEIHIKELGFGPAAYAIADAMIYADGKAIVEITDMSLRLPHILARHFSLEKKTEMVPRHGSHSHQPAAFSSAQIKAYADGLPSQCFGEPYRIFDHGPRILARLPRAPYQFLDEVIAVEGEPFAMKQGSSAITRYAVPQDAWYFAADRSGHMPFAVLLEVALQPCGFLAAYMGSALLAAENLSFRNLGGQAVQLLAITPLVRELQVKAVTTKVAHSGGLIIQNYDFAVYADGDLAYHGSTEFGFFSKKALANQVGIRQAPQFAGADWCLQLAYPDAPGLPVAPLLMVDNITSLDLHGGSRQLGRIVGEKHVAATEWFFAAHFYQDPVMPGSLGLEAFLQLSRVLAREILGPGGPVDGPLAIALGQQHQWLYRGQVLPHNGNMQVIAEVDAVDYEQQSITTSGYLLCDGLVIYKMDAFTLKRFATT